MKKMFTAGLVTGVMLAGASLYAASNLWTAADIKQANALFAQHSGLQFSIPPDPVRQHLHAVATPVGGLDQDISISTTGDGSVSPGPCFTAKLSSTEQGGDVDVVVDRLGSFAIQDANGKPLGLCNAAGKRVM
jgi:hypothetical protein